LDSIPAQGLLELERLRQSFERQPRPAKMTVHEWKVRQWRQLFARTDDWLDHKPAVRYLADERLAAQVVKSLKHFDGERYDLIAWAVMPSHLHWVFCPRPAWLQTLGSTAGDRSPRQRIEQSINRYTAMECNQLLNRTGGFWQRESYDHCVRDEEELERIIAYIHANPVRARLVKCATDYAFSSAREYAQRGWEVV